MKTTSRGFKIYGEYKDSRGGHVRVQESSAANKQCVWIFATNPDGNSTYVHLNEPQAYAPHLTKSQAKRVAKALLKFAESE